MKLKTVLLIAVLSLLWAAGIQAGEQKSLEYFFKKPQYAGFQLSPNGKLLGVMAPSAENRMNIVVMNLENMQGQFVTNVKEQDVNGFLWANNERILFYMDKDGNESLGLFAVNADGSKPKVLQEPADEQQRGGIGATIRYTQVIDRLLNNDERVLVINNDRRAAYPDVYEMDVYTGRKFEVLKNPGNVSGWFTDYDGNVIGAVFQDGVESGFLLVNEETGELEEYTRFRYDEHYFQPAALKGDRWHGYVSSYLTPDGQPRDKAGLYEYNFRTREFGDLVFENEQVDVAGVATSEVTRDIIGVAYMYGKPEIEYVDPRWKAVMAGINQALPDTYNVISSVDDAETIGVVTSYSSTQPAVYYLYDFDERTLKFLAENRPWVKPDEMAEMQVVTYTARDGMSMQGYLTVPKGSDGKNLPTIVHPHGGPWARDGWGYNPEVQFLASRGYAVLQPNFRGSTGFGFQHQLSSRKQWGQKMQDDVSDMLAWAVQQGISNPDKVCIYGGSYGGYATMAGLTFSPELYQCGINYVGVTDLVLFQKTMPDAWEGEVDFMAEMVGDIKEEREFLEQWSPSEHADKIQAPVFMAYGKRDPRVHIDNLKVMEKALKRAGKKEGEDFVVMVKTNEGHGYRKQENQYDFYGRMETFLAENLNP